MILCYGNILILMTDRCPNSFEPSCDPCYQTVFREVAGRRQEMDRHFRKEESTVRDETDVLYDVLERSVPVSLCENAIDENIGCPRRQRLYGGAVVALHGAEAIPGFELVRAEDFAYTVDA